MSKSVFLRAIEILHRDGWCQGTSYNTNTGARCLSGAIIAAGGMQAQAYWNVLPNLQRHTESDSPIDWNDQVGRTKDDVINMLLDCEANDNEDTTEDMPCVTL